MYLKRFENVRIVRQTKLHQGLQLVPVWLQLARNKAPIKGWHVLVNDVRPANAFVVQCFGNVVRNSM